MCLRKSVVSIERISVCNVTENCLSMAYIVVVVVVVLVFYVHGKHLRSCRDGQLT